MARSIRVLQFGLGPIGIETARAVLDKSGTGRLELVAAVDNHPDKRDRDLAEILGAKDPTGIVVEAEIDEALKLAQPHVVLHTTSSFLPRVVEQLETCMKAGADVVSSTEELAYPFDRHPGISRRLDALARDLSVTIVGTGVNPGYVMDALVLAATAPCVRVRAVSVNRIVDAGLRREPLQRKVGAGLTLDVFHERASTGTFGHIGLVESLRLVAAGLGWKLDRVQEQLEPVRAAGRVETPFLAVEPGQVAGIHHVARGLRGDVPVLSLDLKMYVGAPDPRDEVIVDGDPPIHLVANGGIFGDTATAAMLVNVAGLIQAARPGLLTMKDLPLPRAFAT